MSANELSLVAQIVLPLEHFPLYATKFIPEECRVAKRATPTPSLAPCLHVQKMLDFVCQHPQINRAVWTPLSGTENKFNVESLLAFQHRLMQVFSHLPQEVSLEALNRSMQDSRSANMGGSYRYPADPTSYGCSDLALSHAMFCCYMARSFWMLANEIPEDSAANSHRARMYAYQIMRIVANLCIEGREDSKEESTLYRPSDSVRTGFTPLIYVAALTLNDSTWHKFAAERLRAIKREGLYNSEHFAKALDLIDVFRARVPPNTASSHPTDKITPIQLPDAGGTSLAIYYTRALRFARVGEKTPVQVLGRARFDLPTEDGMTGTENLAIEFFDQTHPLNQGKFERCVYYRISDIEPNFTTWQALFSAPGVVRTDL